MKKIKYLIAFKLCFLTFNFCIAHELSASEENFVIDDPMLKYVKDIGYLSFSESFFEKNNRKIVAEPQKISKTLFERKVLLDAGSWNLVTNSSNFSEKMGTLPYFSAREALQLHSNFGEASVGLISLADGDFSESKILGTASRNQKQVRKNLKKYLLNIIFGDVNELSNQKSGSFDDNGSYDFNTERYGVVSKKFNNKVVRWGMGSQSVLLQKRFMLNSVVSTEIGAGISYKKISTQKMISNFSDENNYFSGFFPSIKFAGAYKKSNSLFEGYVESAHGTSGSIIDWGIAWRAPLLKSRKDVQITVSVTGAQISKSAMNRMNVGVDSKNGSLKTSKFSVGLDFALW